VPELDIRAGMGGGGVPAREVRRDGEHADPVKVEGGFSAELCAATNCTPRYPSSW